MLQLTCSCKSASVQDILWSAFSPVRRWQFVSLKSLTDPYLIYSSNDPGLMGLPSSYWAKSLPKNVLYTCRLT